MSTLYDVLGLRKTATSRMIRQAAEAALAEPDAFADREQARQRRSEVRAAWAVLGDKRRRLHYDRLLVADVAHPDWSGGKPPAGFVALGEPVDPKIIKAIPTNRAWNAGSWMLARQADSWRGVSLKAVQPDLSGLNNIAPGVLWALDVSYQPVTDRGIVPVASHVGLLRLKMEGTRVTDAGIAHLDGLAMLQELDLASLRLLSAPKLPRRDRKELEAALPQCTVIY